jgi:hypothetical protein
MFKITDTVGDLSSTYEAETIPEVIALRNACDPSDHSDREIEVVCVKEGATQ